MEGKILKLPTAPTFDLQRFATGIELTNGEYQLTISGKTITCSFSGVTGIGTQTLTTDLISVDEDTLTIGKNFTAKLSATANGTISFTGTKTSTAIKISAMTVASGITANVTTANISDVDFKSKSSSTITFEENTSNVKITGAFEIGDGTQSLNGLVFTTDSTLTGSTFNLTGTDQVTLEDIKYTADGGGKISFASGAINLSGKVSTGNLSTLKTFTTTEDTERDITFNISKNKSAKIDSVTYKADSKYVGKVEVTEEVIKLISGNLTIGTDAETLNGKKYSVESGTMTFKPKSGDKVTIDGIEYTANQSDVTIEVESGGIFVNGKISVSLSAEDSITLNNVEYTAVSNSVFIFESTEDAPNVTITSGKLKLTSNEEDVIVDGITYHSNSESNLTFDTANDSVAVDGDLNVGDGTQTLSGKNFTTTSGESTFNVKSNDTVSLNDTTYKTTANSGGLTLGYNSNGEKINIDGAGVTVEGTGNFVLKNANTSVNINGVDFESSESGASLNFTTESNVKLSGTFSVGDGSQSLNSLTIDEDSEIAGSTFNLGTNDEVKVGGVTYSGNGKIEIDSDDEDKISLSNGSVTVGDGTETLSGKSFTTTEGSAANFNVAAEDSVTINDQKFEADSSSSSGGTSTPNTIKISANNETEIAGAFTFEETNEDQSFNISENNSVTYGNIKYTAKSSSTKVTVNSTDKKITVTEGSIAIGSAESTVDLSGYLLKIISSAQINGVDFTKTSGTPDADVVFDATNGTITLNSAFTVGDGTQKLHGLKIKLNSNGNSIFKLGSDDDVTVGFYDGTSGDVTGNTLSGVTFSGTGNVSVSENSVTITGGDVSITSTANVNNYTFNLQGGHTYTFGATTIDATATSGNISVNGITGALAATTSLSSVTVGSSAISLTNGTSNDGYSITLAANGTVTSISGLDDGASITNAGAGGATSISTQGTGTFTVDSQTFNVTNGTITFNLENGSVKTITTESSATVQVGNGDAVTFTSADTLKQYNGTWGTAPTYASYFISGGTVYGIYSDGNSETAATSSYTSDLTLNGSTVTLNSNKPVKVTGTNFTVNSNSKVYTVNGTANFSKSDDDGITEIESGSVTAAEGVAIDVSLGDNAALAVGTKYTYKEIDDSATSATINVNANGTLSVTTAGTVKKTIANGNTFTFKEETYTAGSSPAEFTVTQGTTDGASLTGGEGSRSISSGTTFALSGTTYTAIDNNTKFVAKRNSDGGFTAFSGNAKYTVADTSFTINEKNYTKSTGNIIYKLTGTGTENGTSTSLLSATGTRAGEGANETATYNGDTYTVTSGTYTIEVTDGTGTETLTSGSATYETTAGGNFHYDLNGTNREYVATSDTTLKISFDGDTKTRYHATGGGTRAATSTETTTDDGYTYALDGSDKILLTLDGTPAETFHDGTATRTINDSSTDKSFKVGTTTYTANNSATLTLTKTNGGDATVALTGGSGTREDSAATNFTFYSKEYTKTGSDDIVYQVTSTTSDTEKVFAATGKRDYDGGNQTDLYGNTYTDLTGTYALTVANGSSTTYTVDARGTFTAGNGTTFKYGGETYSGFNGGASFTLTLSGNANSPTKTLTAANGNGTRTLDSGSFSHTSSDGNTYNVNTNSKIKIEITDANTSEETFYSGTATQTYAANSSFNYKSETYKAYQNAATLTLTKTNGTENSVTLAGKGTRTDSVETFTYNSQTYTTANNITYVIEDSNAEKVFAATGTRAYDGGNVTYASDSYTTTGTYALTVADGSSSAYTVDATGTYSTTSGAFHYDGKTYTGFDGGATLTISYTGDVDNPTTTQTSTSGKGTRNAAANGETVTATDTDGYTYALDGDDKILLTLENSPSEVFYSGTATRSIASGGEFKTNSKTYTADSATTFTLGKSTDTDAGTITFVSGSGTRSDTAQTFTVTGVDGTYTTTSDKIVYQVKPNEDEKVYSATGTRAYGLVGDESNVTFNQDSYTTTGTYSLTVADGTAGTPTLTAAGTYSAGNGQTFHYNHNGNVTEYVSSGTTTLTISYNGTTPTAALTNASGAGTRTLSSGSFSHTSSDGNTYNVNTGATIKVAIMDKNTSTETFYDGTATQTYAANSSFNYNSETYTAYQNAATLTLTKTNGTENSATLAGKGTRTDSVGTFTYNSKTYNKTSGEITYIVESSPTERTFIATGTRSAQGDAFTGGTWGNVYTLAAGSTYSIELTAANDGNNTDVVSTGNATQSFATFLYDHDNDGTAETYTATNDGATFSLSVTNGASTETFSSGSGKRTNGENIEYVIKTTAPIGSVSYTADNGGIVKVTTNAQNEITALESSITGTFNGNNTSKINGITFGGTGTLQVNDTTSVTATNGTFTAQGDFSTARTLSGKTFNVTGDDTVRATFNGSAITQIENLSNGASVVNAGGATTVITDGNGTFTFGSQTFAIANDATAGVTFTLNAEGIVTKIESFQRADNGAYITVDITDGGETYNLKLRHSGDILTRSDTAGKHWTEPDVIQMYVVTYDGTTFTVEALDTKGDIITINNGDYSSVGTKLTLNDTSKPVVVKNSTSTQITVGVGAETNVNSTGSKAIKIIDDEGHFKLGTLSDDKKTFTVSDETPGNFEVSKDGEVTIGDDGKITVTATGSNNVTVEVPQGKVEFKQGSYTVNGKSTIQVTTPQEFIVDSNGNITGVTDGGSGDNGEITIIDLTSFSFDLADNYESIFSADLAESADESEGVATGTGIRTAFQVGNVTVITINDDDGVITYVKENGKLKGVKNVSTGATIEIFGTDLATEGKIFVKDFTAGKEISVGDGIINYNSVTSTWHPGNASAYDDDGTYKVEIGADGKIRLYTSTGIQTKNVADYTAALGSTKPDKDGGTLPNYVSGISAETGKVSEVVVKAAGTYLINGKSFTVSGETKFEPTDSDAKNFSSIDVTLEPNQSLRYNNISYSGNNGANVKVTFDENNAVTLDGNAKIEGSYSAETFTATGTVTFGKVVVKDLSSTAINYNPDAYTLTIGGATLKVEGDDDYTFSVSSNKLTGISDGAKITNGLNENLEVNTDLEGVFEIGDKKFTIAGDSSVTFTTGESGAVTSISNLNGTVKGDFSTTIKVNDKDITVSGGAETTLTADGNGVSKIHVVGNGTPIILGSKTYDIGSGEADFITTNGTTTIKGITNITGTTEIKFKQAESNFQVGDDTITLSGSANDTITLTISDNKITTVEGLTSDKIHTIKGLSAGTKVKVAAGQTVINGDDQALNVSNVSTAVTAIAKDGGYSQIEEVAAGTQFTTIQNGTVIVPKAAGDFFFADDSHIVKLAEVHNLKAGASNTLAEIENLLNGQSVEFAGDFNNVKLGNNSVTFTGATSGSELKITMGADYKVATVENLLGTIKGLPEGAIVNVATTSLVKINEQDLTTSAAVKVETSADGYKKITDVAGGTTITATQAVDIVTKEVGTFTIKDKKFEVVGDTSVTFKTDASGAVTEVTDITNAKLKIYSEVTLSVNGVSFTIPALATDESVELSIDAAGNISGLNIGSQAGTYTVPDGLSVEVNSNSAVTINGKSVTVDNGSDAYKVRAKSGGYDQISDVAAGATITAAESGTIIIPKEAGIFTVGSNVVELNEVHNLKVGDSNTLAEIENLTNGQSVELQSAFTSNLKLGNNTITLTGATTTDGESLTVKIGDGNNISSVENLRGTIKGLPEGAEVKIAEDTAVNINADSAPLKSTVNEVTAIAKADGYKQVKVKDGDIITAVASGVEVVTTAAGTFKVGSQTYKTDDAQIKLTTGDGNKVISVTEIDNGKTLEIYQTEESLTVGNDAIAITNGTYSSKPLKLTMDANGNISLVENLQSAISGLIAGTQIKSTSSNALSVNGQAFQTSSTVEYIITAKVGGYEKVTIKPDTTVTRAVAGTKLVTNGDGYYTFHKTGGTAHKINVVGDAEVTLEISDDENSIANISGINNATLQIYQAESSLKINGEDVKVPNPNGSSVELKIDGNGKVTGMSGSASGEYNLDEGSTINIKTAAEVTINGKALQISDTDYTVRAKGTNEGYDLITGVNSGATFTQVEATNVSIKTDGAGTYTFPSSHVFNTNDSQIIFVVGDTADEVKQIQGLDVGRSVELRANETALKVGNDELTIAGIATLTMGDNGTISAVKNLQGNVSGLSAGALVEVKKEETAININGKALNVSGNNATVRVTADGYDMMTIKSGDVITSVLQDVSIVADDIGTYEVNGHKFYTNDTQITLVTGEVSGEVIATQISGLDEGRSIALYDDEDGNEEGLKIGNDTFTITGNGDDENEQATLTMGSNGTISSVKNLRGDVNGLQAGALAQVSITTAISFNANADNLQISEGEGGANTDYTVRATADGYDLVTGIGDGANIQTFKGNASIVTNALTNAQGTYTFKGKAYVVDGDNSVTIKANDNGSGVAERIAAVDGLNGSIKGDFVEGIDIDGKKVKVTDDTGDAEVISIAADGSRAVQIYGVGTGAVVEKAGGASTISTEQFDNDDERSYTFGPSGGTQHTYAISKSNGATINFIANSWVDYSPVVTGIKNLGDAAQVVIYGDETALNVELDTITVKGADENNLLTLTMEGDTIKSVGNLLGEVSGLRTGAEVAVKDADVTINGAALKIDEKINGNSGTADYTAYALTGGGYGTITGIGDAVIDTAANVSIVADVDKTADADAKTTIKFKDGTNPTKDFVIKEDSTNGDGKVTLATDAQSKVTAIGGLYGTLQSPEQYNVVNGATIYSTDKNVSIVANKTADDGISGLYGLTKDQAVTVPSGTTVTVKGADDYNVSDNVSFTINGTAYNLMGDTNGIIIKDKTIKNLDASARLTIGAAGNYVVNGTSLTITEGTNVVVGEGTAAHLANDGDIASFTPAEEIVEKILGEGATSVKASDGRDLTDIQSGAVIIDVNDATANLTGNNVLAVVESEKTGAQINITGTNDSVVSAGTATAVDLSTSTNTNAVLMQTGGSMTVSNYDHTKGASIQLTNSDVIALVKDSMTFSDSSFSVGSQSTTISYATNANIINFRSLEGDIQKVGYTTSTTNTIDTRTLSGDFVFKRGNEVTSIFYGGGGNDTAFGSAGDYFDLGDGDNYIEIVAKSSSDDDKVTVGLTATDGLTEVKGFTSNDVIKLDASVANAYYTSKGLIFTNGNASLQVDDLTPSSSNSAHVNVKIIDTSDGTNSPIEIAVARENGAIVVSDSDDATAYVGKNSALDLSDSGFTKTANIDLRTGTGTIGTNDVTFKGITSLKGGETAHTLIGSASESTTIRAGKGAGSISGGGSTADLLIGNSDDDKEMSTFDFTSGSGKDTISGMVFENVEKSSNSEETKESDKILLTQLENLTASNIGSNVVLGYANNGTDSLTIENALGETFRVTAGNDEVYMAVGKDEVNFDGASNSILYATGENAKLKLSAMGADSAKLVNLSGDDNFTVKGSFAVLDGSEGGANLGLIGNSNSNTIIAANVGSSLYGSGGDNSLVGGSGNDEFWAGWESGDQTLSGVGADDTIYLYNFNKVRIKNANISAAENNGIKITTNLGSIKIVPSDDNREEYKFTIKLGDGTHYDDMTLTKLKEAISAGTSSADLVDDYEGENWSNDQIVADPNEDENIFWDGYGESGDLAENNVGDFDYLNSVTTGNIEFTISGGKDSLDGWNNK